MFTKVFWMDALERAIATAAQVVVALGGLDGANLTQLNLKTALLGALFGALASLLKSIAATQVGDKASASLLPNVTTYKL